VVSAFFPLRFLVLLSLTAATASLRVSPAQSKANFDNFRNGTFNLIVSGRRVPMSYPTMSVPDGTLFPASVTSATKFSAVPPQKGGGGGRLLSARERDSPFPAFFTGIVYRLADPLTWVLSVIAPICMTVVLHRLRS